MTAAPPGWEGPEEWGLQFDPSQRSEVGNVKLHFLGSIFWETSISKPWIYVYDFCFTFKSIPIPKNSILKRLSQNEHIQNLLKFKTVSLIFFHIRFPMLIGVFDFMQQRWRRQPAAAGCLEAENAIGCFNSAGLQGVAGDAGAAWSRMHPMVRRTALPLRVDWFRLCFGMTHFLWRDVLLVTILISEMYFIKCNSNICIYCKVRPLLI